MGCRNARDQGARRRLAVAILAATVGACGGGSAPSTLIGATPSTTAEAAPTTVSVTSSSSTSTSSTSTTSTSTTSTSTTTTSTTTTTAAPPPPTTPPPTKATTTTTTTTSSPTTSTTTPVTTTVASTTTLAPTPPGSQIYAGNCGVCHGWEGEGGAGADLRSSTLTTSEIIAVVTNGRNEMPSWMGILTPAEIEAVAAYVKGLQGG